MIGDEFVHSGRATVLVVPSVLAPVESNWLINPRHSGFAKIRVHPADDASRPTEQELKELPGRYAPPKGTAGLARSRV